MDIEQYIKELEGFGLIDPNCRYCLEHFYPLIRAGSMYGNIFYPSHKARKWCESGQPNHCTCDKCF